MISSVFGKTKPINFIILLGFLFIFYWFVLFFFYGQVYSPQELLLRTLVLGVLIFGIFIVDFIVKRNQITGTNSFAILYYTLLIIVFPETLTDTNAIFCSFFLLLAFRRIISIRSLKNIKLKVFDATLWITVASLFYDWALLFLLLAFIAIYFYEPKNIRNWMVPLAGISTAGIIAYAILILANYPDFIREHYRFAFPTFAEFLLGWDNSIKLLVYIFVVIATGFLSFLKLGKLGLGRIITMRIIAIAATIGFVVTILKSEYGLAPVLITFFPAATLITKYLEMVKRINIKEIILLASVFMPFLILLTQAIIK